MNETIAGLFRTLAPTVASAILGPLGGVAVAAIAKIIGVQDGKVESITKAFADGKITPDQLAEIKKLELQYQNDEHERGFKYAELEFKREEVAAGDRASAREREIAVKDWIPGVLAVLITAGFFGILFWMLKFGVPKDGGSEALLVMLGALGAAWGAVCNYYFGSSAQQVKQAAVISKIASAP